MTAWATAFRAALDRERQAFEDRLAALAQRCDWNHPDGGWRCTEDAEPDHEHRYDPEDLPSVT